MQNETLKTRQRGVECGPDIYLKLLQWLEIAEQVGTNEQTYAQAVVELVVVEQVLTIAVVVMEHQELVAVLEQAKSQVEGDVTAEIPSLALHVGEVKYPSLVVGHGLEACLEDTAILEYVAVVLAVNNGYPQLAVYHEVRVEEHGGAERYLVPAARLNAVAAVRFVLDKERCFSHQSVFYNKQFRETYTGVEVEVAHGHRVLKHIPHRFFREKQECIGLEGQDTLGETLGDTHLELHVAVGFSGAIQ